MVNVDWNIFLYFIEIYLWRKLLFIAWLLRITENSSRAVLLTYFKKHFNNFFICIKLFRKINWKTWKYWPILFNTTDAKNPIINASHKLKFVNFLTYNWISRISLQVIIKDKKVKGVQFYQNGELRAVKARKEVIISGGSVNTPKLLMLSGIGPREELQKWNVSKIWIYLNLNCKQISVTFSLNIVFIVNTINGILISFKYY